MNLEFRHQAPVESNIRHRQSNREVPQTSTTTRPVEITENPALLLLLKERTRFLNFVRSSVRDLDAAEEILQRVSLKAISRAASLRDPARAEAWIYRLLRNEIADHFRRLAVQSRRTQALAAALPLESPLSSPPHQPRLCPCAIKELDHLRPSYSDALRATEMNGEAVVAYAARKGLSASNATVRLHRARKALRVRLQAHCGPCAGSGCFDCSCTA